MERLIKKGTIVAKVLDDCDLFENKQVAVYDPINGVYVEISKLSHIAKDQWITEATTKIKYDWELHDIIIADDKEVALRCKDWEKAISLLNQESMYEFTSAPFKQGLFSIECQRCHSHFEGSKSQGICSDCCVAMGTATLLTDDQNKSQKVKKIKQKSIPLSRVKELLSHAFDAGRYSTISSEAWISRQDL
jgi:Zn finger protein HypA/HybF involved in hydrogenase expression